MAETGMEYLQSPAKRRFDVLGALAIGAALVPAAAVVASAASIDTGHINPIFTQRRAGQGRGHFDVYKFRTINPGDPNTPVVNGAFDRRASPFGRLVRSMGLDEAPQIVNVLKGEMSLVGIRPLLEDEVEKMRDIEPALFDDWHDAYRSARPGLTGPGQLRRHEFARSTDDVYRASMRLDLEYVESASLENDIAIISETPLRLLRATTANFDAIKVGRTSTQAE